LFTINEILDIAVRLEKNSEAVYRQALDKVSNPDLAAALAWIAEEEVLHAQWFENLKDSAHARLEKIPPEGLDSNFLKTIIGGQSFSLEDVNFSDIQQLSELLDIFIESEKDGILFYQMLQPFIRNENTRTMLKSIIAEEKRHIQTMQEFVATPPAPIN